MQLKSKHRDDIGAGKICQTMKFLQVNRGNDYYRSTFADGKRHSIDPGDNHYCQHSAPAINKPATVHLQLVTLSPLPSLQSVAVETLYIDRTHQLFLLPTDTA